MQVDEVLETCVYAPDLAAAARFSREVIGLPTHAHEEGRHLAAHAIALEAEITWPNGARSVYFRDPAGNSVELATATLWGLAEPDDDS